MHGLRKVIPALTAAIAAFPKVTHRNSTSLYAVVLNAAPAQINTSQKGALLRMTGKAEMGSLSFFLESFPIINYFPLRISLNSLLLF